MTDFSQLKPAERQLQDITSPVSPVEDRSDATALSGVVGALAPLAQTGVTAFVSHEVGKREQQALKQQTSLENQYVNILQTGADMLDQGGSSSAEINRAKTYVTQQEKQLQTLGLDAVRMLEIKKKFEGTSVGTIYGEESIEDQARKAELDRAIEDGFVTSSMTDEQVEAGVMASQSALLQNRAMQAQMEQLKLLKAQLDVGSAEDKAADREIARASYQSVANLVSNYREPTKNKIMEIVNNYNSGRISRADAEGLLQNQRGDLNALIAQAGSQGNLAQVEALAKPLVDLYNVAIANIDSNKLAMEVENQNRIAIATSKNNLLRDPETTQFVALSSLFGHTPSIALLATEKVSEIANNNSNPGNKPHDVADGSESSRDYLRLIKENVSSVDKLDLNGQPVVNQEELLAQIDMTLKGANRNILPEDAPSQSAEVIKWLADPQVGEYIKSNLNKLSSDAIVGLTDTLLQSAENHIYPAVSSVLESVSLKPEEREQIDMIKVGNKVMFKAMGDSPFAKSTAQNLNNQVGNALNSYFKALANLTDDSFDTIYQRELKTILPEKYGEPTEDGMFVDTETGEEFEVRDGKRVEAGDFSDMEDGVYRDRETGQTFEVRRGVRTDVSR